MGLAGKFLVRIPIIELCGAHGYSCQGLNPATKRLEIATTPNQDPLLTLVPIIGVDIWEHAFYLQYLNVKADVSYQPSQSEIY